MRIIRERDVLKSLTHAQAIRLVENAFRALALGKAEMPPKIYLTLPKGDFRAMPASLQQGAKGVGMKWISVFPGNRSKGKLAVIGHLLLNDPETGELRAVIEANELTALRTGAAGALATRLLHPRVRNIGVVGAGVQSAHQIRAHLAIFKPQGLFVWSPKENEARSFGRRFRLPRKVQAVRTIEELTAQCDVICTCTPSRKPVVPLRGLQSGTHINAIGADAPGKQELDAQILRKARVFVDDWEQASHSGEINVAVSKGLFRRKDLAGTLGELLVGRARKPRAGEITVFDSTGLAVQDMALAHAIYNKAA